MCYLCLSLLVMCKFCFDWLLEKTLTYNHQRLPEFLFTKAFHWPSTALLVHALQWQHYRFSKQSRTGWRASSFTDVSFLHNFVLQSDTNCKCPCLFEKTYCTHKWNVSLYLGDQLLDLDFVECLRFLSLRWGPMRCTSTRGQNMPVVCHLRPLAATTAHMMPIHIHN